MIIIWNPRRERAANSTQHGKFLLLLMGPIESHYLRMTESFLPSVEVLHHTPLLQKSATRSFARSRHTLAIAKYSTGIETAFMPRLKEMAPFVEAPSISARKSGSASLQIRSIRRIRAFIAVT